ncbi:hypothetical protein [Mycobacterium vicinigordonae]|uniref:Uncharacterized protein n=1 Tax=Mycobacterium vicinigordonae TaxID=1719132 RepID=A0A7D6E119_9MYCO|nr:hypothetical protein [Mycobacterium vicinigordonae]QLL06006.1 hypothetical protein H0P51_19775 [Mycobacterium vicinigordonae]
MIAHEDANDDRSSIQDAPSICAAANPPLRSSAGRRGRLALWLSVLAVLVSAAVLVVAIGGREPKGGPTLRPMGASESMSDEQARVVADSTVRTWIRERNERRLANLKVLSCPDPPGMVGREIEAIKAGRPSEREMRVIATGALNRRGAVWGLNTHLENQSMVFVLRVDDGELRVCAIGSAPVP